MRHIKHGWRALATLAGEATGAVARKRGFDEGALFVQWRHIVGDDLADACVPLRLSRHTSRGRVLHIAVNGPHSVLLQHRQPQMIERINAYLGWTQINSLVFHRRDTAPPSLPERR